MPTATIQTQVQTDPMTTWQAYTDPSAMIHWNFASDDWRCADARVELKIGGIYWARLEAADGSMGFDMTGHFDQLEPGASLQLTLEDGRRVETTFQPEHNGTTITTVFELDDAHPADFQQAGWQAILDNFAKYMHGELG